MPSRLSQYLGVIGPGVAIAATGVGAGDLVAAGVTGSKYGMAVVWAVLLGALFKYALNEGLARWQLATGTSLVEGWVQHLGKGVQYFFLVYLVVWSFVVGGALVSACGLAGHTLYPAWSVQTWGMIHSALGVGIAFWGGYGIFEKLIKLLIGVMFVCFIGCALFIAPPEESVLALVREAALPPGSAKYVIGVVGGVGGSLTLLSYGYWIREKKWEGPRALKFVRADLMAAYILIGIFGGALMVLADYTMKGQVVIEGNQAILQMASSLEAVLGRTGYWIFVWGFWGAVASSLFGVWQSVPYLFCDYWALQKKVSARKRKEMVSTKSPYYRAYLFYLAVAPLLLLYFKKPVFVILIYAVVGSVFMPFLASTLLYMNAQKKWVGKLKTGWMGQLVLTASLVLFGWLSFEGLSEAFRALP